MTSYAAKAIDDQRRPLIGWSIAVTVVSLMYTSFYPSIKSSAADLQAYVDKLPEAFKNIIGENYASPTGYLRGEVFSSLGLLLLLIFAIGAGARAIAGEEENRTLDLLLSTPLRRAQILRDKAAVAATVTVALVTVLFVVLLVMGRPFDLVVPAADLATACLMLALVALAFGGIALAVGAATGRRVLANSVAGGYAVLSLIVNALAPSVTVLEPLRPLSPFRWYLDPDPLTGGLHVANVCVLAGIAIVGYAVALVVFERRDLQA
ncbi:MAG: ABC transporter permease subunit [Planctomycetaceae bacterium]